MVTREREKMQKQKITAKINAMKKTTKINEDGSAEQQHHAALVEQIFHNLKDIREASDEEELEEVAASVLLALTDIQVRDYLLGLMTTENKNKSWELCTWLTEITPAKYMNAPASMLGLLYYEDNDKFTAQKWLGKTKGYSLAALLNRVIESDWPAGSFEAMRKELHPKVKAGIFGGTDDNN